MQVFIYLSVFLASLLLQQVYINFAKQRGLLDIPNQRSSHTVIKPRGGGAVFIGLWLLAVLLMGFLEFLAWRSVAVMTLGPLLMSIMGLIDDKYSIAAKYRLLLQLGAAALTVWLLAPLAPLNFAGFSISMPWLITGLSIIAMTWSANLFNFMDGTDGIAAVEAIFVIGFGCLVFIISGHLALAQSYLILLAAIAGFLVWNWPDSKVFMGDTGSSALGLLIPIIVLQQQQLALANIIAWLIIYGLFIFDTAVTLCRRCLRGEKITEAHRKHAYQRLQLLGWDHLQILLACIVVNTLLFMLALWAWLQPAMVLWPLMSALVLLSTLYLLLEWGAPMYQFKGERC